MSKIEVTEEQANAILNAFHTESSRGWANLKALLNKAIELGLVRPASDDLAARVAALEAKVNRTEKDDEWGLVGRIIASGTPDPHAAAKERQSKAILPKLPEPRADADRLDGLAEVAFDADGAHGPNDVWARQAPGVKQAYRNIALAVRKAVLAAQLEPSEEEWNAANDAYQKRGSINDALIAAARVRLEKAEGEVANG